VEEILKALKIAGEGGIIGVCGVKTGENPDDGRRFLDDSPEDAPDDAIPDNYDYDGIK
jgi:hypothetical protein